MRSKLIKFYLPILLLTLISSKIYAITYDWVGTTQTGGVYNWNNKLNWKVNGNAATSVPGANDDVTIAVNAFSNDPTITDAQKCASITFGVYDNFTLTVNGSLTVSGNITQNNDPFLDQTTVLAGTGNITCNNFNVGDITQPAHGSGIVINISSQVGLLTVKNNIVLTAVGNGGNGIEYPFFSLDANKITLYGQIVTKTYNSPTLEGVGDPNYPGFGLFQMDSYEDDTTLELLNAAPVATIPNGFTVDFTNDGAGKGTVIYDAAAGTQTVYTTGTSGLGINSYNYDYLTFGGASAKTVLGGALTIGKDLTSGGTGAVDLKTNGPAITIHGNWTNSVKVTQGASNIMVVNNLKNSSATVTLGAGTLSVGQTLQISSGTIAAGTGTVTVNGPFINTGTFKCGTGSVVFKGNYTNSKIFTASTGTVYFSGASQTLIDNGTTGSAFNKVTFNGSGTATMSAGKSNFSVSPTGVLSLVSPAKLVAGTATAAYLTLKSAATGSATVAPISGSSAITGSVNVERYLTGGSGNRGYRLLSSPVYAAIVNSNCVYSINYLLKSCYVTGTTGAAGGFDKPGNPTIYLFRENMSPKYTTFLNSNFRGINTISSAPNYLVDQDPGTFNIPRGNGFQFFFRGDRGAANLITETITTYVPVSTTLTATGTLNQGQITVKNWYTPASPNLGRTTISNDAGIKGFNLVGNPYASSIDWDTYNTTTPGSGIYAPNVKPTMYVYNTRSKNYGAYTSGLGGIGTNGATNIIPSGEGFFVIANSASAKLVFNESAKTNSQVTGSKLLMGNPVAASDLQYFRLQLALDSINTDDMVVRLSNGASPLYVVNEDAPYKYGYGVVSICSMSSDNIALAINQVPFPKTSERISVNVNVAADGHYKLNLTQVVDIPKLYDIWLVDAYKKDSVNIRTDTTYGFDVLKSDSATFGAKRFSLVIGQNPEYAYKLLDFGASKISAGKQVQVVWKTQNEGNYTRFTIERSTNAGNSFDVIGSQTASNQGTYSFTDQSPVTGQNMYRLKQEEKNSNVTYSQVVTVTYADKSGLVLAGQPKLNIYPNPANSVINLAVPDNKAAAGSYRIRIMNSSGMVVRQVVSSQNAWQGNISNLLTGTYVIEVVNNKDNSLVGQTKFVKL